MKSQQSFLDFCRLTIFFWHHAEKPPVHCATVHGSVFRIIFIILDREFESVETSSGLAQILGENWDFQMRPEKKLLNDKSLDMNVVISGKKYDFALGVK